MLALAALVQCAWSLSLWILSLYALLVMRPLRNQWLLLFFTVGDGITTILHYVAAWISNLAAMPAFYTMER
ncbi:hypothetical protein PVAP13_1KG132477 [Panicum virgatum]|uniref:Uncharacterized protein n=1 Tax=Panicum virgatum TaxID=38727 RepID=A0A8T0XA63_PANVG|nr:hypothetical protein PVAP13_1KG132477 [Panicum virgatum]